MTFCHECLETYDDRFPKCPRCRRREKNHRKKKYRQHIVGYIKAMGCQICGDTRQYELTFHHIDPATKKRDIASLVAQNNGIRELVTELEKCACICEACHRSIERGRLVVVLEPIRLRRLSIPLPHLAYEATAPV